jgi:hypothetical protein
MSGDTWGTYKGEIKGFRFENSETKRLGPAIGASGVQPEIDRDSDGVVGDGTPDEKPTPNKQPDKKRTSFKPGYILEDSNGQLQQFSGPPPKDRPYIREQRDGTLQQFGPPRKKPQKYKPGYILEDRNGQLQQYDGPPPKNKPYLREKPDGNLHEFGPDR